VTVSRLLDWFAYTFVGLSIMFLVAVSVWLAAAFGTWLAHQPADAMVAVLFTLVVLPVAFAIGKAILTRE
jgi:hypothetical protein